MRPSNKRSRNKQNRPRTLGNIINRVFDSSMEWSKDRSLLYKFWMIIKRWVGERLTLPGKVVMLAACAMCLSGAFPEHTSGSFGFSLFVAMIVLSLATSILRVPKVELIRF